MRDDLSLGEYYCLLAEALDADELEDFNITQLTAISFHNPKYLKKWKWSSIDKAGTAPLAGNTSEGLANMALKLSKGEALEAIKSNKGIYERAKATGRHIIFMDHDMNYFDEQGNSTERLPLSLIIRVPDKTEIH